MPTKLQPGDCLLYRPSGFIGRLIALKTWSPWSHVELAIRQGKTIAARETGVNYYDTRWDHLGMVVRPPRTFDLVKALEWFDAEACGQRYDLLGLFRFFTFGKQSLDKQFCSELLTRAYRAGGVPIFDRQDADLVPPGWFATMGGGWGFMTVWTDGR